MDLNTEKQLNEFQEFVNVGKRSASDFDKLACKFASNISDEELVLYLDIKIGVDKILSAYNKLSKIEKRKENYKSMESSFSDKAIRIIDKF